MVSGRSKTSTIPPLLLEIAARLGVGVKIEPGVEDLAGTRPIQFAVNAMKATDVLDELTQPYDVASRIGKGTLILSPDTNESARQRDRARRAIASALESAANYPRYSALLIEMGNLDFSEIGMPRRSNIPTTR